MSTGNASAVPGTQLCHRALYAAIVGHQPRDCPPGASVRMTNEGPFFVDHVMRVARRYVGETARRHAAEAENHQALAMNAELVRTVETLDRKNKWFEKELETCAQQLDARKREVQMLQNKLRQVYLESRKEKPDPREPTERGAQNRTDHGKPSNSGSPHGGHQNTQPPCPETQVGKKVQHNPALSSPPPFSVATMQQPPAQDARPVVPRAATNNTHTATPTSQSSNAANGHADNNMPDVFQGDFPLQVVEDIMADQDKDPGQQEDVTAISYIPSALCKNGVPAPVLPRHLLEKNPGAMVFCRYCRYFFSPNPLILANHLQIPRHQSKASSPSASQTTCIVFGKLVQYMPFFIEPVTVVSEEEKRRETANGNPFFEDGLDIVHPTCSLCNEIVTAQSYKVHESLPSHRRRLIDTRNTSNKTHSHARAQQ